MKRPEEIRQQYETMIVQHLDELVSGKADKMLEIEDFAAQLFIHPTHLSNTIQQTTGLSACGVYQFKILDAAKGLLNNPHTPVKDIAYLLDFAPTQFTKWFKKLTGFTPKQYRANTETMAIL